MLWDHNLQHNLYLLFVVFILPPNVHDNQYDPVVFTVHKLNNDDGTLRYGTFEQNIF